LENQKQTEDFSLSLLSYSIERLSHGLFYPNLKIAFYLSELYFASSFLLLKNHKDFDVIYSRQEWIIWFLSFLIKSPRLVWESHEAKLNLPAKRILKKGIKVVAISEGIFEDYIKFGKPKEQMVVAHDGIDESFFEVVESKEESRKRLGLPAQVKIAMYIGGFDGWKGIETFLTSSDFLEEAAVVAIGGSREQVAIFTEQYPKVTFLGQLPYSDLRNNQQAADVLVIPNSKKT
jgi:glycosyltransferase involved in cell wall biosynthesis